MKRFLPLLLILLLLLAACGSAPDADRTPDDLEEDADLEEEAEDAEDGPGEDETPILLDGGELPFPKKDSPALSDTVVTLNGLSSYLRLTLPEGWTWEQAGGTVSGTVYGLYPENEPSFKVEMQFWPDGFGMCGTGVTFTDYPLPNGQTATLATEENGGYLQWTLILPEAPDAFTIQFGAETALYEGHRAELELMLGSLQHGVLAGLDVVKPEEAAG